MGMANGHGALEKEEDAGWEGQAVQVGLVDGHGAFEKEEDSGWDEAFEKKILVGKVRVSRWGWSMAMCPLKRDKIPFGRVRVSKR